MKPFNLEEALAGKSVLLRNGDEACIKYFESELKVAAETRVVGYSEGGLLLSWCPDGYYNSTEGELHHWDIVGMYPETKVINGFEVPAPESKAPEEETNYYLANPVSRELYSERRWQNTNADIRWLERGLVFLVIGDAVANSKAMMGIDPNSWTET